MLLWFAFIISVFYLFKVNIITSKQCSAAHCFQVVMLLLTDKIKTSKIAGDSMDRFVSLTVSRSYQIQVGTGQIMRSWLIYPANFFSEICTSAETHSFADIYAIRVYDGGNNHSLPALL